MFKTGDYLLVLFIIFLYPMLAWNYFKVSPLPEFRDLIPITSKLSYLEEIHVYRRNAGSYEWLKLSVNDYSGIFFANSGDDLNSRAYKRVKNTLRLSEELTIWAYKRPQTLVDVFNGDYNGNLDNVLILKKTRGNSDEFQDFNEPDKKVVIAGLPEYKILQLAMNQKLLIDYQTTKVSHESNMKWNTRIWFGVNIFIVGFILFKLAERSLHLNKRTKPK